MQPSISIQAFRERRTQQLRVDRVTKRYATGLSLWTRCP
jgi:hypothetical protein